MPCRQRLHNFYRYQSGAPQRNHVITCRRHALRDGSGLCSHHHPDRRLGKLRDRKHRLECALAATNLEISRLTL